MYHDNTTTNDERVSAVSGHEIEHATSEVNYDLKGDAGEVEPNAIETQILKDIPNSKPIKMAPIPIEIKPIKIDVPTINTNN